MRLIGPVLMSAAFAIHFATWLSGGLVAPELPQQGTVVLTAFAGTVYAWLYYFSTND